MIHTQRWRWNTDSGTGLSFMGSRSESGERQACETYAMSRISYSQARRNTDHIRMVFLPGKDKLEKVLERIDHLLRNYDIY